MFCRTTVFTAVTALLTVPAAITATASPPATSRPPSSVILDWQRTSMLTIYGDPTAPPRTPIPVGVLYLGFVSLAMHDAVDTSLERTRSSEAAAAAAAAHDVLVEYFPTSAPALAAALDSSLAAVPDGSGEDTGVMLGQEAAARMIASRRGDGRDNTSIRYSKPLEPGFWQPTPPTSEGGDMLAPWLGSVRPLVLEQLVTVDGPDALDSRAYARDYDEVRRLGSDDSTARSEFRTSTARFFNSNSAIMVGEATVAMLDDDPMPMHRTARLFAVMHGAMADSIIKCWEVKRDVGFWRPFQAIAGAAADGNPQTEPEAGWAPLIPNPPYSDYFSGHASLTAPAVETLRRMLGEDTALTLHSYATGEDRSYDDLMPIERQAFGARIWGGLHFRDAMDDGYALGHETARRVRLAID